MTSHSMTTHPVPHLSELGADASAELELREILEWRRTVVSTSELDAMVPPKLSYLQHNTQHRYLCNKLLTD